MGVFYGVSQKRAPTPDDLRQTDGIRVEVIEVRAAGAGYQVTCAVENTLTRHASSVVLTIDVVDSSGQLLAQNPLVNLLDLMPGERRILRASIPRLPSAAASNTSAYARASVSLVRWMD